MTRQKFDLGKWLNSPRKNPSKIAIYVVLMFLIWWVFLNPVVDLLGAMFGLFFLFGFLVFIPLILWRNRRIVEFNKGFFTLTILLSIFFLYLPVTSIFYGDVCFIDDDEEYDGSFKIIQLANGTNHVESHRCFGMSVIKKYEFVSYILIFLISVGVIVGLWGKEK